MAWMKSWGREKVLVAWIKSLGVGEQAGGVNEEWRRCWRLLGWVKVLWEWKGTCWVSLGSLGGAEGKRKSWGSGGDPFG